MRPIRISVLLLLFVITGVPLQAQSNGSFEDRLERLATENAEGYLSPVVTGTGIGLNSGIIRTAKVHKLLGFDLTISASGISIPDDAKTYRFRTSALGMVPVELPVDDRTVSVEFDAGQLYPAAENAPTFFGSEDPPPLGPDIDYATNKVLEENSELNESMVRNALENTLQPFDVIPRGFDIPFWALPNLQASVGLPYSTELQIRFTPTYSIGDDVGDFSLRGIGGRISIDQFIPIPFFPVDIAAGAFFQRTELGPVTVNSSILHAEVSKTLLMLTVYGGLGLESSNLNAEYSFEHPMIPGQTEEIEIDIAGDNQFRATIGAQLQLLLLRFNLDYTLSRYNSINLGVGVSFR